jgi:hypothetical protein
VCGEVVQHDVDVQRGVNAGLNLAQEGDEVLRTVLRFASRDDLAGSHVEGGEEIERAVADVVVRASLRLADIHRQDGLRAFKRLNLRFLVNREHNRVGRGIRVEAHDIADFVTSWGSGESLNDSIRWGCKRNVRQIRPIVLWLKPAAFAIDRVRQCVSPAGVVELEPPSPTGPIPQRQDDTVAQAVVELNDGAIWVSADTCLRLACDAAVVVMQHRPDGSVLDVGRRRRTIPSAIRRALATRDQRCRFPGCTARRCDAHHIEHWMTGGRTSLENTMLLCRTHHRAVHEGGFSVGRDPDGRLTFQRPDGVRLEAIPPPPMVPCDADPLRPIAIRLREAGVTVHPYTCAPRDGQPLDLRWAIDVLRIPACDIDGTPLPHRKASPA